MFFFNTTSINDFFHLIEICFFCVTLIQQNLNPQLVALIQERVDRTSICVTGGFGKTNAYFDHLRF